MGVKVERVLVQGTVTFQVSCNVLMGMVTPEEAASLDDMEEWFADKAFKLIDSANVEVEYDHELAVEISKETADRFTGQVISNDEWKQIIAEHKD